MNRSEDSHCFWLTKVQINNVFVSMSRIIYQTVYLPLAPIVGRSSTKPPSAPVTVSQFSRKEVILPITIELTHSIYVFTNGGFPDQISHKLDLFIHEIEAIAYLNFRDYLDIYTNTLKPLEAIIKIVNDGDSSTSSSSSSTGGSGVFEETQPHGSVSGSEASPSNDKTVTCPENIFEVLSLLK